MDFKTIFSRYFLVPFSLIFMLNANAAISVNLTVENLSGANKTDVPVTVGQAFKEGDIASNETVGALLNGKDIPIQVDKKATHRDGSLRHAVLSLRLPSLAANSTDVVTLYNKPAATSGASVALSQLLATNFDAVISLTISGKVYTASAKQLLQNSTPKQWLSGPEVSEWIVSAPFKDSGNASHPHLTARFNVRAYAGMKSVRVSAIVENNWTYVPNPSNFTYDVSVTVGGAQVYSKSNVTHYHHARWRKVFWWGTDPQVFAKLDLTYLKQTMSIPNYDYRLKVTESTLSSFYSTFQKANNNIMGVSILNPYMPSTGGRPDIGPLPNWAVFYLLTMDPRAWDATKTVGELAGSWSSHFRDEKTDLPVKLTDYPTLTTHPNALSYPENPLRTCTNCSTPYTHDENHQASMAYLPYLVTGDYYFLEELQFWANQNAFGTGGQYRGNELGLYNWNQIRGQAWSMRTLGEAAYITPDAHPLKSYFNTLLLNNINNYVSRYTNNGSAANSLGIITDGYALEYNSGRGMAPWQDDFFTWAIGHIVELGYTEALPLLKFKATFPVGRMTAPGYCWIDGSIYSLNVKASSSGSIYATFGEAYRASVSSQISSTTCGSQAMATAYGLSVGEMTNYSSSAQGNPSILQPALAVAVDSGVSNAIAAWDILENRSVKPDYNSYPNWDIVPRNYRKPGPPVNIQLQVN